MLFVGDTELVKRFAHDIDAVVPWHKLFDLRHILWHTIVQTAECLVRNPENYQTGFGSQNPKGLN
jgi:hypothetical protein